ncbi:Dabb family protein [Bacillus sinesaloumensis]|uniref:Dabb family protein n=1 Tax=Litchfieldia sinesaloumensis TaxID=1926280 RepID=UPI00098886EE|nr:Dabb family protein [Bacillus sinesaloumensis]
MYEHLVVFKFNEKITKQRYQELLNQLLGFKKTIPGIVDLSAGMNVTGETDKIQGYNLGLRITFEDRQALDDYLPHPIHQQFGASLQEVIENVIVVDYEIQ